MLCNEAIAVGDRAEVLLSVLSCTNLYTSKEMLDAVLHSTGSSSKSDGELRDLCYHIISFYN